MNTELKKELLRQFTFRCDNCIISVDVRELFYYLERIHKFGTPTKLEIRKAIMELHDENLIRCVPLSNNVYNIYT